MLNRRSLRIKGMQAIFAYQTAKVAEYNICKKLTQDQFLPDLNSMEEQDKEGLKIDREHASEAFDQLFNSDKGKNNIEFKPEIIKEAKHYLGVFSSKTDEIRSQIKSRLISDLTGIYDDYIKILSLILEMDNEIEVYKRKKGITHNNFAKNQIIMALRNFKEYEVEVARKNVKWDTETIRTWFRKYLKPSELFEDYDGLMNARFEDDQAFVLDFFKNLIFKHEDIDEYFEGLDIGWVENRVILKSMVLKTIKSITEAEAEPQLVELSKNWEDDLEFLKKLFDNAIEKEDQYGDRIKEKSKNWEIERMPTTDKIILEMAIAEMIHFPSIPVKVTINEYIELSKQYSTPKSKQYVNGLLDVLSVDLQNEGLIKKSGRGLLDNK